MQIIALDWGQKRIGVAVGDTANRIPFPRDFIIADNSAISKIKNLCQTEKAGKVLLGLPRKLDGTEGESAQKVHTFAEKLRTVLDCPIEFADERFTSTIAQDLIHSGAQAKHKRQKTLRQEVDSLAALELLRNYFRQV